MFFDFEGMFEVMFFCHYFEMKCTLLFIFYLSREYIMWLIAPLQLIILEANNKRGFPGIHVDN